MRSAGKGWFLTDTENVSDRGVPSWWVRLQFFYGVQAEGDNLLHCIGLQRALVTPEMKAGTVSCVPDGELDSRDPSYILYAFRFRLWASYPKLHSDLSSDMFWELHNGPRSN